MNNNIVATFEKVSYEEFKNTCIKLGFLKNDNKLQELYNSIKLPTRATNGSAGYDFYIPINFTCNDKWRTVPTGIKCKLDENWVLFMVNKSGLGKKYRTKFSNTFGVVDSDYYGCEQNEGHILMDISSEIPHPFKAGDKFCQGIFLQYGIATNDIPDKESRIGGYGSTGVN